ncbi:hypothetical protein KA005_11790 [bacterium]|nr:hypothetical protein [bacterium]
MLLLFFDVPVTKVMLLLLAVPIAVVLFYSVENLFIFLIVYSTCFHLHSYSKLFKGFLPIKVSWTYVNAIFTILLIYWIFSFFLKGKRIKITAFGYAILSYVTISMFSFFHGLLNGYIKSLRSIRISEIYPQLMYLSYFIFLTTGLAKIRKRILFDFMLGASAFIGVQLIYVFTQNRLAAFSRINTITVQIAMIVFPYVLGIVYFAKSIRRKVFSILALVPISFAVLICLQRSLWLALIVALAVSLFIYFYKQGFSLQKILALFFAGFLGFVVVLAIAIFGLSRITSGAAILVLLKRFLSFSSLEYLRIDPSAFTRMTEIKQALAKIHGYEWFVGRGIGDTFYSFLRVTTKRYFDNCYAWVLWKMGIVGLIAFLSMFAIFFQRALYLLRRKISNEDLIYVMAITLNMLGILICSLGNASLIQFRYIIIWSISMAVLEQIYRRYRYENSSDMLK